MSDDATNAGAPPGLDVNGSLVTGTFFADNSVVAYRMLWGIKDANNNLIIGAPSQRFIIENGSGSAKAVSLTFTIPDTITTAWFYQIYRTLQFTPNSVEPNDEMQLAYEGNPSSTDISNKYVTVTDNTPDSLLGVTLYTSPSQEGIQNENLPPPYAKDMTLYNNMVLYANTKSKQVFLVTLLGAGAPAIRFVGTTGNTHTGTKIIDGLGTTTNVRPGMKIKATGVSSSATVQSVDSGSQVTATINTVSGGSGVTIEFEDIVTIDSVNFYASAAETIANGEFKVSTGGSPAENIADTANSLIRVINRYAGNTVFYAYYLSGFQDLPGQMEFEARVVNTAAFQITSTAPDSFNPTLPTSGNIQQSSDDEKENGVYISKVSQPEAVPIYSFVYVGSANKPIRRILALRDSVFIFKDDGIFRLTGTSYQSIVVSLFDGSKKLIAYDSPAVFDNQIFCFVDQGIAAVSEQGVQIISKPIENVLLQTSQYANFPANTFGVGYDSDRKYLFWTVQASTDTYPTIAYVWNAITGTWTDWLLNRSCGLILSGVNKLYMGNPVNDFIYVERKTLTYLDYADESYAITINSIPSSFVIVVASATNISVGDAIMQGTRIAKVIAINGTSITLNYALSWTTGAATVNKPFDVRLAFTPLEADNPSIVKQFSEASYMFKEASWTSFLAGFSSNNTGEDQFTMLPPANSNGDYGNLIYGEFTYGGINVTSGRIIVRTYIPLEASRANWITGSVEVNEAFANISLMGISYLYNMMTSKLIV